jgi:hypothetical protein
MLFISLPSKKSPRVVHQKPDLSADRTGISQIGDFFIGQRLVQGELLPLQKPAKGMATKEMDREIRLDGCAGHMRQVNIAAGNVPGIDTIHKKHDSRVRGCSRRF